MSKEHERRVQDAAITCEAFLGQCGLDPDAVAVSKIYELATIYKDYGPEAVREFLGLDDIGGGIPM